MTDHNRRRFLERVPRSVGAAPLGLGEESTAIPANKPAKPARGELSGLAEPRRIIAGVLDVAYLEVGPGDGPAVILLHGWPYDVHAVAEVAPLLASAGFRVIIPHLRGFGPTRFRNDATVRNGQQAAIASDVVALMDALLIPSAILAGFDWGARAACCLAALEPGRCAALVSVSGYLIGNRAVESLPLLPRAELTWWYQFYFATERGRAGYDANRQDFAKLIWQTASPEWRFDDATFARSAASLVNPDHVAIVIHNYRWRLGLASGEARYDGTERLLETAPTIHVPTITLEGDANRAPHPEPARYASKFVGKYGHQLIGGRRRAQLAAGGTPRLCPGDCHCGIALTETRPQFPHRPIGNLTNAAGRRCR